MVMQKKSLGEVLVEKGVISQEQLKQAREVQKSAPGDLGVIIHDLGFASEREVASARASVLGLQFVDLTRTHPDPEATKAVPEHIVKRYNILPIKRDSGSVPNKLMVAVGDIQSSMAGLDDVRLVSRCHITPVLAAKSDIEDAIARAYNGVAAPTPAPSTSNGGMNGTTGSVKSAPPAKIRSNGVANPPAIIKEEPQQQTPAIVEPENALVNAIKVDLSAMQLETADEEDELDVERMSEEAPIIRMANAIV